MQYVTEIVDAVCIYDRTFELDDNNECVPSRSVIVSQ